MSEHEVIFRNATDQSLHFVINRRYQGAYGSLDGVAWQVCGVPAKKVESPAPTGKLSWTNNYGITIVEFKDDLQRYEIIQHMTTARLGYVYSVTTVGGIPSIDDTPAGQTKSSDDIMIQNKTSPGQKIALGYTLGDKLIGAEKGVSSGMWSIFKHTDTCYVTCFGNMISHGEIIPEIKIIASGSADFVDGFEDNIVAAVSSGFAPLRAINRVVIPPVDLKLREDKRSHTVEANIDLNGIVRLTVT